MSTLVLPECDCSVTSWLQESGTRKWGCGCDSWAFGMCARRTWGSLEHCAAEVLGCCKRNLVILIGVSKKQNTKRTVDSKGPDHEILEGEKRSTQKRARGHSHCILAKILVAFCLCPKNWSEAEFKGNKLICLKEETCIKESTQAKPCFLLAAPIEV